MRRESIRPQQKNDNRDRDNRDRDRDGRDHRDRDNRDRDGRDHRDSRESRDNDLAPGFAAPETVGGSDDMAGKRKRRRRNKRGNQGEERQQAYVAPRDISAKTLSKRAWKIFLGEVTEEGLALMDDNTSREVARRAFKVAEAFLIEEARRKQMGKEQPAQPQVQPKAEEPAEAEDTAEAIVDGEE